MPFTNIVTPDALYKGNRSDWVVFDCRSRLGEPAFGRQAFLQGHLPGARYLSLDEDLAAAPGELGRHPLPPRDEFVRHIERHGVSNTTQFVVYDDAGGAYAARAWWMFKWLGHAQVAVLDGGLNAWPGPLESGDADPVAATHFTPGDPLVTTVDASQVSASIAGRQTPAFTLLDARTEARWAGREEPVDTEAGHIPGALCLPFQGNLNDEGRFHDADTLRQRFAAFTDPVVCYCGSGVTACHNLLALDIAGRQAALFVDSWSGWITDPNRPRAREA